MATILLDGKRFSASVRANVKIETDKLTEWGATPPGLAFVIVGNDPASHLYVGAKQKACAEVGIKSQLWTFPETVCPSMVMAKIQDLNQSDEVHGILVQLPLPAHLSPDAILGLICVRKDVDGFHPLNFGKLIVDQPTFVPCTPFGILHLLKHYRISLAGKRALVIGRSKIVGKPLSILLLREHATVTIAHSHTPNLETEVRTADILVSAVGKREFIPGSWIKPGAIVIDVGINVIPAPDTPNGRRVVGDVEFKTASERAEAISPVPGGVGPMTIAMLLVNTLKARLFALENSPENDALAHATIAKLLKSCA
jgi:methylenetetrahydrofolate dehydrogenase (NADP+)/methenyltetrahydrofolate cyclohydrolase